MEQRYPAEHCVLIDDKLRIFSDVKIIWDSRVTMVFHRQGHYALDPHVEARFPPADATITRIGDLLNDDLSALPLGKGGFKQ